MVSAVGRRNIQQPQLTQPRLRVSATFGDLEVALGLPEEPCAEGDGPDQRHARHEAVESSPIERIVPKGKFQKSVVVGEAGHELADNDQVQGEEVRTSDVDDLESGKRVERQVLLAGFERATHEQKLLLQTWKIR